MESNHNKNQFVSMLAEDIIDQLDRRWFERVSNQQIIQKMLYNVKEAAVYLGRSESAIRHLIEERELPCVKKGSRVQIYKRDMDEWIEKYRR